MDTIPFSVFPKIARLSRACTVTEKIDGTNACIYIGEDGLFLTGSRNRWITPEDDNFGFSRWAHENKNDIMNLGAGLHHGEWWGSGIQRGYGLPKGERRFSLFNTSRWDLFELRPLCCQVVPMLFEGEFSTMQIEHELNALCLGGSRAAVGFMDPEGVVVYHTAAGISFKKTIERDEEPKTRAVKTRPKKNRLLDGRRSRTPAGYTGEERRIK
ncbi:MAG: hypothetical protein DDT20_00933 [Firmicutes bacterium]|nr:hypothetical protein [Bacillota bacterium]